MHIYLFLTFALLRFSSLLLRNLNLIKSSRAENMCKNARKWRQAYRDNEQHRIAPGQSYQQVIDRWLHLRAWQDDHRDRVADDPEEADQVDQHPIDDEVGQTVAVDLLTALARHAAIVIADAKVPRKPVSVVIIKSDCCRGRRAYFHRSVSRFSTSSPRIALSYGVSRCLLTLPFSSLQISLSKCLFISLSSLSSQCCLTYSGFPSSVTANPLVYMYSFTDSLFPCYCLFGERMHLILQCFLDSRVRFNIADIILQY